MAFHEVRFPTGISFGSVGGPERRTEIVTLGSGFEERNTPWAHARRRYNAGLGVKSLNDVYAVIAFFEARAGRLHGFRWKDWTDFRSASPVAMPSAGDQVLGLGDGSQVGFQLVKQYVSGAGSYARPIQKPVGGSVIMAIDGTVLDPGTEFSVDITTGIVTLATAPGAGQSVSAGFEFDVPVRFDTDHLEIGLAAFEAGEIPGIPIVELRLA